MKGGDSGALLICASFVFVSLRPCPLLVLLLLRAPLLHPPLPLFSPPPLPASSHIHFHLPPPRLRWKPPHPRTSPPSIVQSPLRLSFPPYLSSSPRYPVSHVQSIPARWHVYSPCSHPDLRHTRVLRKSIPLFRRRFTQQPEQAHGCNPHPAFSSSQNGCRKPRHSCPLSYPHLFLRPAYLPPILFLGYSFISLPVVPRVVAQYP